ncbi:MAG: hypothetical protein M3132_12595 [Actinomycetia bacterium]|nr:hypothetical protein [Actinomycetes bacterium]
MANDLDTDSTPERTHRPIHEWIAVSLFGFLLLALGLALDPIFHANDTGLGLNNGLFTIANAGHWLLGFGIVATAIGLWRVTSLLVARDGDRSGVLRIAQASLVLGLVVLGAAAVYVLAGPGIGHADESIQTLILSDGTDRSRLPQEQALALATLAWTRPGSLGEHASMDHGAEESAEPTVEEDAAMAEALAVATASATRFDTIEEITALGYVQASGVTDGAGAHWIKWSIVDKPFDIENPSMLLFDQLKRGEDPELIAYSYWVTGEEAPEGFPGPADEWHPHLGMCFENGRLKDDNLPDRRSCNGDWINGSDIWMLHAWIVPGLENELGVFANVNPFLCERACGLED